MTKTEPTPISRPSTAEGGISGEPSSTVLRDAIDILSALSIGGVPENGEQLTAAKIIYRDVLSRQGKDVTEIADKQEALAQAGAEIIDEFAIEASLFANEGRGLIFTALADRWATNKNNADEQKAMEERTFIANALALLAYEHSPKLAPLKTTVEAELPRVSKAEELRVYDKYTDRALSKAMEQKIADGLLDEVKARLGITPENESPYEIRVITVDKNETDSLGLVAPPHTAWEELEGDSKQKLQAINAEIALTENVQEYKQGLRDRAQQMAADLGIAQLFGTAWVVRLGEDEHLALCIAMPLAEKIISPELTAHASHYTEADKERDLAVVEHEYTHTQQELSVGFFGNNITEIHAEANSGNKLGYGAIKDFFGHIKIVTGFDTPAMMQGREKGGTRAQAYTDMVNNLGIQGMLEVLMAPPADYLQTQSNQYQRGCIEYLGGYDGILSRLLEREKLIGIADALDSRIKAVAGDVVTAFAGKEKPSEVWAFYRRERGLNVVTDLVVKKIEELKEAA